MDQDLQKLIDAPRFPRYHEAVVRPRTFNPFDVLRCSDYEIRHSRSTAQFMSTRSPFQCGVAVCASIWMPSCWAASGDRAAAAELARSGKSAREWSGGDPWRGGRRWSARKDERIRETARDFSYRGAPADWRGWADVARELGRSHAAVRRRASLLGATCYGPRLVGAARHPLDRRPSTNVSAGVPSRDPESDPTGAAAGSAAVTMRPEVYRDRAGRVRRLDPLWGPERDAVHVEIRQLRAAGHSLRESARALHVGRGTVERACRESAP